MSTGQLHYKGSSNPAEASANRNQVESLRQSTAPPPTYPSLHQLLPLDPSGQAAPRRQTLSPPATDMAGLSLTGATPSWCKVTQAWPKSEEYWP